MTTDNGRSDRRENPRRHGLDAAERRILRRPEPRAVPLAHAAHTNVVLGKSAQHIRRFLEFHGEMARVVIHTQMFAQP